MMHRCFVTPEAWKGDRLTLDEEESRHLITVLRAELSAPVLAFDGEGREADAEVAALGEVATLRILAEHPVRARLPPHVVLVQAFPKGSRMDEIIERATELGAAEIRPTITEHAIGRRAGDRSSQQIARWRRIAISAAKQCGTPWIPTIHPPSGLDQAITAVRGETDLFLVGSLEAGARPARDVLRSAKTPAHVTLLIGPEGDLSPDEYRMAGEAGAIGVSFGPLVLRVETAAIYGLSAINYELR
jgi:16S rRNA (uracil1498-N3)-methyltransferase